MTASLKLHKPESMDPDTLIEWSKNAAAAASHRCTEARDYYDAMHIHYENVTQLLAALQELREKQLPGWQEDAVEAIETLTDVVEAMDTLANERVEDHEQHETLEAEEAALLSTSSGREAAVALDNDAKAFLSVYLRHKARLGLKTQDDVATLTGISRRHVSAIERGMHKPQFRTLVKLADAFGVEVTEFIPGHPRRSGQMTGEK